MLETVPDFGSHHPVFMDDVYNNQHHVDELEMVQLLADESSDQREEGLNRLLTLVQSSVGSRLELSEPLLIFQTLGQALSDNAWETRHKCVKIVSRLVPLLDADIIDAGIDYLLMPLVICLGDAKATVSDLTAKTLSICAEHLSDVGMLVTAIIEHGINSKDNDVKKAVVENLPMLFERDGCLRSADLKPLVLSLVKNMSARGNQLYFMHSLRKIEEFVGKRDYESYVESLPIALRNKYYKLLKLCEDEDSIASQHESSDGCEIAETDANEPCEKSLNGSHVRQAEKSGGHVSSTAGNLVYGIIPAGLIDRLNDQRTVSSAADELEILVNSAANLDELLPHLPNFIKFLTSLLGDRYSFAVIRVALDTLDTVAHHFRTNVIQNHLSMFIAALFRRMSDTNVVVRKLVMQKAMSLMQIVPPSNVIDEILTTGLSHKSMRTRQRTLDIVTSALLQHPSNVFDLVAISNAVTRALLDQKKLVRHAAMECIAVIAQAMGAGRQQPLMAAVVQIESVDENAVGLMAAIQARLARRQLPAVNDGGLIEYAPISSSASSADAEWIANGTLSSSSSVPSSAHSHFPDAAAESDSFGRSSSPAQGRRHLSATKSLSKLPWEREASEVVYHGYSEGGRQQRSAPAAATYNGDSSPEPGEAEVYYGGRQSAVEQSTRSRHVLSPRATLSMTWPNSQMFDENGGLASGSAADGSGTARGKQRPLRPLSYDPTVTSSLSTPRSVAFDTSAQRQGPPPLIRGSSNITKNLSPLVLPELAKSVHEVQATNRDGHYDDREKTGQRGGEEVNMNDSLRQIRNSASKKQLNKIFELKEPDFDRDDRSDSVAYNEDYDFSTSPADKMRKETFFESKPRLSRRNTLLLRDGDGNTNQSNHSFSAAAGEVQSVTVVGKGYGEDFQSNLSPRPLRALHDKKRVVKGSVLSPVNSSIASSQFSYEDAKLPSGVVGKAALSGGNGTGDNAQSGAADDKPTFKGGQNIDYDDNRDSKSTYSPPAGIYGRGVQRERTVDDVCDDTESGNDPRSRRISVAEKMNRSRKQYDYGAGESEPNLLCNGSDSSNYFREDHAAEDVSLRVRKMRRTKKPLVERQSMNQMSMSSTFDGGEDASELKPFRDPQGKLTEATQLLAQEDWTKKTKGLNHIRCLAVYHDAVLCSQLPAVMLAVTPELKNLRSQVSRKAMECLADMFNHLKKNMDNELDRVVPTLLGEVGKLNKFIREDAEKALTAMIENTSHMRALNAVINAGVENRNPSVRNESAKLIWNITELMGADRIMQDYPERILPVAAKLLMDGQADARYYGQMLFHLLMQCNDFDRLLGRHIPQTTLRHIQDKLDTIRKKGPVDPPVGVKEAHLRRTASMGKGLRGNSAPSSETGLLPPAQVGPMSLSATERKRPPLRVIDDSSLTQGIMSCLESNDWERKLDGIRDFRQLVNSDQNLSLVAPNLLKIFNKFIPCLQDANNKVKLEALQTLEQTLPVLSDIISNLTSYTVQTVTTNLSSKNRDITDAAAGVLDAFMEHSDPGTLLQPFMSEARRGRMQITIDMTDRIAYLVPKLNANRISQVLPFVWYLLSTIETGTAASGGGRSSKLRNSTANFVTVVYSVIGEELPDAAAMSNSGVTAGMRRLLDEFIAGSGY